MYKWETAARGKKTAQDSRPGAQRLRPRTVAPRILIGIPGMSSSPTPPITVATGGAVVKNAPQAVST